MNRGHHRDPDPGGPWADRLVEAGVLGLLVFTPLAYGTVEPWSEAAATLLALGVAAAWVVRMVADWEIRVELPPGWVPAALFLGLVLLQVLPLPGVAEFAAPEAARLHEAAARLDGAQAGAAAVSLAPHATRREGLKLGAVALLFLAAYNTYRSPEQARRAIWTMVAMGALLAVFGIVQRMTWNGHFYWIGPRAPHAQAFGPFVNRAHFAGLVAVIVPMALALVIGRRRDPGRRDRGRTWRDRLRQWNSVEAGPVRLVPFLVALMGGAALVSGSRGGLIALLAVLLGMVALAAGGRGGRRRVAVLAVVTAVVVLAGAWIAADALYGTAERLAEEARGAVEEGAEESPRLLIWADALALWQTSPLLGSGLAGFEWTFPRVRTFAAPRIYTHAESDWLELLTDTGVAGVGLALAAVATVGWALLRRRRRAESGWTRAVAAGAAVALLGAVVQGIGNYNLPVMSNLVYLAVAAAIGLRAEAGATLPPAVTTEASGV